MSITDIRILIENVIKMTHAFVLICTLSLHRNDKLTLTNWPHIVMPQKNRSTLSNRFKFKILFIKTHVIRLFRKHSVIIETHKAVCLGGFDVRSFVHYLIDKYKNSLEI